MTDCFEQNMAAFILFPSGGLVEDPRYGLPGIHGHEILLADFIKTH